MQYFRCSCNRDQKTYTYTGSDIKPVPTVTLGKAKLSGINDYHVTYQNNKKQELLP